MSTTSKSASRLRGGDLGKPGSELIRVHRGDEKTSHSSGIDNGAAADAYGNQPRIRRCVPALPGLLTDLTHLPVYAGQSTSDRRLADTRVPRENTDTVANVTRQGPEEFLVLGDASNNWVADSAVFLDDGGNLTPIMLQVEFGQHNCWLQTAVVACNEIPIDQARVERGVDNGRDDKEEVGICDHVATLAFPAPTPLQERPARADADEFRKVSRARSQ